jgi:protein-tyrosine-phosphatase
MAELKVKTGIDGAGWARGLEKMTQDASNFGKNLSHHIAADFNSSVMGVVPGLTAAIAGVFSIDGIKDSLKEFSEKIEHIGLGAKQMNISPELFQQIDRVMKETGGSAEDVRVAFEKVAEQLTAIQDQTPGWEKAEVAMGRLGIAGEDLKKTYQEVFLEIAKGLQGVSLSQEQIAAGREVMGRGFDTMMRPLAIGGFDSAFAKAGTINEQGLATGEALKADLRDLDSKYAGFWNKVKTMGLETWDNILRGGMGKGMLTDDEMEQAIRLRARLEEQHAAEQAARLNESAKAAMEKNQADIARRAAKKFDSEDQKKADTIDKETEAIEERDRVAGLSPEAKRLELTRQIAMLEEAISFRHGVASKTEEAQTRKHMAELKHELSEVKDTPERARHALSHMGNQALGGILLGHDRLNEMAVHARTTAHGVQQLVRNTTPHPSGRGGHRPDYP